MLLTVIMQVTLPNGLQAVGSGATKKLAKHDAARAMLDIMDGRAAAVTEKVSAGRAVCLSLVSSNVTHAAGQPEYHRWSQGSPWRQGLWSR